MVYKLQDNPIFWISCPEGSPDFDSILVQASNLTPEHILKQETYGHGPWIVYLCLKKLSLKYPGHFDNVSREFYSSVVAPTRTSVLKHPHCLKGMPALAHIVGEGSTFLNDWIAATSRGMTKTEFGQVYMGPVMWKSEITDIDLSLSHGNLAFLNLAKNFLQGISNPELSQLVLETEEFFRNYSLSDKSSDKDRLFYQKGHLRMGSVAESFALVELIHDLQSENLLQAKTTSHKIANGLDPKTMGVGLHFGLGYYATLLQWVSRKTGDREILAQALRFLEDAKFTAHEHRESLMQVLAFSERPEAIDLIDLSIQEQINWDWMFAFGIFQAPAELELFR